LPTVSSGDITLLETAIGGIFTNIIGLVVDLAVPLTIIAVGWYVVGTLRRVLAGRR